MIKVENVDFVTTLSGLRLNSLQLSQGCHMNVTALSGLQLDSVKYLQHYQGYFWIVYVDLL
jgi:hypothetical protein